MAVRGSGIGASSQAMGIGLTSTRSGSAQGTYGMPQGQTGSVFKVHVALAVIVLLELGALLWLRHAFRHHQGG